MRQLPEKRFRGGVLTAEGADRTPNSFRRKIIFSLKQRASASAMIML